MCTVSVPGFCLLIEGCDLDTKKCNLYEDFAQDRLEWKNRIHGFDDEAKLILGIWKIFVGGMLMVFMVWMIGRAGESLELENEIKLLIFLGSELYISPAEITLLEVLG